MNENEYWDKLAKRFEDILTKYEIVDKYAFDNKELSEDMSNIQARFDGERLFDTEIEDLEDLEVLIKYLEEDLVKYSSKS